MCRRLVSQCSRIGSGNTESTNDQEEGKNPVPAFTVNVGNRKFGQGSTRVETSALVYTCAAQDAQYLKALLSAAQEKGYLEREIFVLTGIHLIESPEVYKG